MIIKVKHAWWFYREHGWLRRGLVVGLYLLLAGGLLINFGWLHRQSNANDDTPLNTYQTFNDDSSQGVKLVSRGYQAHQERLMATVKVQPASDPTTEIVPKYLQFKVATVTPEKVKTTVIPVTENKYVVLVDGLKPDFQALRLRLINRTPQTGTSTTTDRKVDFVITQPAASQGAPVTKLTPIGYAKQAINDEINQRQTTIQNQKNKIKTAQAAIKVDQDKIQSKQANLKYEVASEQSQTHDDMETLRGDIGQNQQNINGAKQAIKTAQAEQKLLQAKQKAIESGQFKLPKMTTKTQLTK